MPVSTQDIAAPYLSVVVTSRNDSHGGDPLVRLQAFMNTFDAQCRRFALDAELVVVEWNPPPDRPRLHGLVRVPPGCAFPLRFVEVPPALHDRLPRAEVLPLFQMIAKNAGIRRARGQFVLSTNIDIIFSNELVEFFAARRLRPGVIYRVDRHDIESDYPVEATLDEQMAYCRDHHLRVHRTSGTYPVDRRGRIVTMTPDVFAAPSVTIGDGWHVREGYPATGYYRWATARASLFVNQQRTEPDNAALILDIEPNPYHDGSWVQLEIVDGDDVVARTRIAERKLLQVALANGRGPYELVLRTVAAPETARSLPAFERRPGLCYRLKSAALRPLPVPLSALRPYDMSRWRMANGEASSERTSRGLEVRSPRARQSYCLRYGPFHAPRDGPYAFVLDCTPIEGEPALHVVDERADCWIPSEEHELADADGERRRVMVSVTLKRGQAFSLYVAKGNRDGDAVSRFVVHGLSGSVPLDELAPRNAGALLRTTGRTASKLIRAVLRRGRRLLPARPNAAATEIDRHDGKEPPAPAAAPGHSGAAENSGLTTRIEDFSKQHRLAAVHRNAAGDFQLMARQHWFELHGYPEFTMYSMNVDGLMGDIARHAGVTEEALSPPLCIYHLEHAEGSGWTPEGEGLLRKRLADSGADWLDAATVDLWCAYMDWLKRPMIFNGSDWGVGDATLRETTLQSEPR